jgi:hypothetical protein
MESVGRVTNLCGILRDLITKRLFCSDGIGNSSKPSDERYENRELHIDEVRDW